MKWHTMVTPAKRTDPYVRRESADVSGVDLRTARAQLFYVEGETAATNWADVAVDLQEYWQKAAELFTAALPGDRPLDRLHIHINPEGGQLKAYLGDSNDRFRASPLVVNGIIQMMAEQYEALPDPEEFDEEFGVEYVKLCLHARDALAAASKTPAAAAMKALMERHKLKVLMRWEDDGSSEELVFE